MSDGSCNFFCNQIEIWTTNILYKYLVKILIANTQYNAKWKFSVQILGTNTQYKYSVQILSTNTQYEYPVPNTPNTQYYWMAKDAVYGDKFIYASPQLE